LKRNFLVLALVAATGLTWARPGLAADFKVVDGDRVVLIGDTLIERDQKHGYLETLITAAHPDKSITFRNLGWSADTVRGLSRARFGPPEEGWQHLIDHVIALKPTVLIVGYGMAESFDGEAGLPAFVSGLNALLDAVSPTKARVVLLSPVAHADMGRPLPDPTAHNTDLERYTDAIGMIAGERGARFIDLYHPWKELTSPDAQGLTEDGIHLTDLGYWAFGVIVSNDLLGPGKPWLAQFHHNGRLEHAEGTKINVDPTRPDGVHFQALDIQLPTALKPLDWKDVQVRRDDLRRTLVARGLPNGSYRLTIDGDPARLAWETRGFASLDLNRKANAPDERIWAGGVKVLSGPEFDQVEALRQAIIAKNRLYFYRWRPQNETYLFGFRKHEQGNNAREIPLFDPLVEAKEQEIAKLRKPVTHVYELIRESEAAK
jgi:lysophospholipase L1-like esterase